VFVAKKNSNFAVVVVTFNRAHSLKRLLESLKNAVCDEQVNLTLVISIDGGGSSEVIDIANECQWYCGEKVVIQHGKNIGLRSHIIKCGDLTNKYGAVLILEDDLYVSPHYYNFTSKMVSYYKDSVQVAGVSLYSYRYNEYAKMPFLPVKSKHDVYFMQVASSWGQLWTKHQWLRFKKWYNENKNRGVVYSDHLPLDVIKWPETSWKKYFQKYMVEEDLYLVYPYDSYVTNFADMGSHFSIPMQHFQVPLAQSIENCNLCRFENTKVLYDSFYEPMPIVWEFSLPEIYKGKTELDLFGCKTGRPINAQYLISINKCKTPIKSYSSSLIPPVYNVIEQVDGNKLELGVALEFTKLRPVPRVFYRISRVLTPSADDLVWYCLGYFSMRLRIILNKVLGALKKPSCHKG